MTRCTLGKLLAFLLGVTAAAFVNSCDKENPSAPASRPGVVFDGDSLLLDSLQVDSLAIDGVMTPIYFSFPRALRLTPQFMGAVSNCPFFKFDVKLYDGNGQPMTNWEVVVVIDNLPYGFYYALNQGCDWWVVTPQSSPSSRFGTLTNSQGIARFQLWGGGHGQFPQVVPQDCTFNANDPNGYGYLGARVYIGDPETNPTSVLLGRTTVSCPDLDNNGYVNVADQTLFMKDYWCMSVNNGNRRYYKSRSDFTGDGTVGIVDLSRFLNLIWYMCPTP